MTDSTSQKASTPSQFLALLPHGWLKVAEGARSRIIPPTAKRQLQHRSDKIGLNNEEGALAGYTKWRLERNMKIFELMERTIHRIDQNSTVQKAAEKKEMGREHIGSLVVTDAEANAEITRERDIMTRTIAENRDLRCES